MKEITHTDLNKSLLELINIRSKYTLAYDDKGMFNILSRAIRDTMKVQKKELNEFIKQIA